MNLDGKTCGNCDKGKLREFQNEVSPGILVEAFRCDKCHNVAYRLEVMRKIEAMQRGEAEARSLMKIGSSLVFSIPIEIVKRLGLKPKEKVYVTSKGNQIIAWVSHG